MLGADPQRLKSFDDQAASVASSAQRMAAALAATGAVLLGALQIAHLGQLHGTERIVVAAVGGAVAVIAVIAAVMATLNAMLPPVASLDELRRREAANPDRDELVRSIHANRGSLLRGDDDTVGRLADDYDAALTELRAAFDAVEHDASPEREKDATVAAEWTQYLNGVIAELLAAARLQQAQARFRRAKPLVALLAIATAAGVVALIWATNGPDEPTLDLRGANLNGARLTGSSSAARTERDDDQARRPEGHLPR